MFELYGWAKTNTHKIDSRPAEEWLNEYGSSNSIFSSEKIK